MGDVIADEDEVFGDDVKVDQKLLQVAADRRLWAMTADVNIT